MSVARLLLVTLLLMALTLPLVGCKDEGPAEKAGKKIDEAVDSAKDKAKKLFE